MDAGGARERLQPVSPQPPRPSDQPPARRVAATAGEETRLRERMIADPRLRLLRAERARPQRTPVLEHVVLPRVLVRRPMFDASHTVPAPGPPGALPARRGELYHGAVRLGWPDLRAVAIVCTMYARTSGNGPVVPLGAHRLAKLLLSGRGRPNAADQRRARATLARLTEARVAFEMDDGTAVGSPDRPVSLLEHDPHRDAPDEYRLPGWLHELMRTGLDDPRTGLLEMRMRWSLLARLRGRGLLMWAWLEAESWNQKELGRPPNLSAGPVEHRHGRFRLSDGLRAQLGVHGLGASVAGTHLRRSASRVSYRHWAYEVFDVSDTHLQVWRLPDGHPAAFVYLGEICKTCGRPDPDGVCCHRRSFPQRCGDERCWACREGS